MKKIDFKSVIIGILGTTLIFVSLGATKQTQNFGHITVKSLSLVDDNDEMLAKLESPEWGGGGSFQIYDPTDKSKYKKTLVSMSATERFGGSIYIKGINNEGGVSIGTDSTGGSVEIQNPKGGMATKFDNVIVEGKLVPSMVMVNQDRDIGLMLYADHTGGSIEVLNNRGSIITLKSNPEGDPLLQLWSKEKKSIVSLGRFEYGGVVVVSDDDGNPVAMTLTTKNGGRQEFYTGKERIAMIGANKEKDGMVLLLDRYGEVGWGETGKRK